MNPHKEVEAGKAELEEFKNRLERTRDDVIKRKQEFQQKMVSFLSFKIPLKIN